MTENLALINVRLTGYEGLQQILIANGTVVRIVPMTARVSDPMLDPGQNPVPYTVPDTLHDLDLAGDWLSLGGVDLQINGALGLAFPDLSDQTQDKLGEICDFLWREGVSGFLPTIVTTSVENIQRSLSVISRQINASRDQPSAQILGVHLEGPFLHPQKRGAHPQEHLLPLTLAHAQRILGDYAGAVKVITLAPELDATGEVIPYLRSLGITVSLGHSLATAAQAQAAFDQGATMVTHAFNAMPPLHHREPGLLGAAIVHPQVHCGLIADGQHVCPIMMEILLSASRYERGVFLVSDALAPLGLPDGIYPWDTRQIEVKQGTARLPDGTLTGTTLSLLVGAQNLVKWGLCEAETAIALATTAPRQAIGLPVDLIGQPIAHLLRWKHLSKGELCWQRLQPVANDKGVAGWG